MIDGVDTLGDVDGQRVPTQFVRIVRIEIVGGVGTVTAAVFHHVFVVVADDDGKIPVLLHAAFRDGLDGTASPVAVGLDDRVRDGADQLPGRRKRGPPVAPRQLSDFTGAWVSAALVVRLAARHAPVLRWQGQNPWPCLDSPARRRCVGVSHRVVTLGGHSPCRHRSSHPTVCDNDSETGEQLNRGLAGPADEMWSVGFETRAFRRLWLAGTLFRLAAGLRRVAVPWLVLVRTGSTTELGIALAIGSLDLLVTPVVGPLIDRHRRRRVVALAVVGYAVTLLALPALAAVGALTLPAVYLALFLLGVTHFVYHNARHAWVPELVEDLDTANAAIHGVGAVGSALFVAAGGVITTVTTPLTAVGAAGLAALVALLPLVGVPESIDTDDDVSDRGESPSDDSDDEVSSRGGVSSRDEMSTGGESVSDNPEAAVGLRERVRTLFAETRAGVTTISRQGLWPLVAVSVGINVVAPAYGLLFAAVGDLYGTALAFTALAVGYDLGKVTGNAVVPRLGWGRAAAIRRGITLLAVTTLGLGGLGFAVEPLSQLVAVGLLTAATFVVGVTQPVFNVPSDGMVQEAVADDQRGTVVTVTNALYQLPFPLAYLAGGVVAEQLSPFTAFLACGGVLLAVAALAALTIGERRVPLGGTVEGGG